MRKQRMTTKYYCDKSVRFITAAIPVAGGAQAAESGWNAIPVSTPHPSCNPSIMNSVKAHSASPP
jgi:hypothetical protein